jgi:YbbR domain-containing protein
MAYHPFRHLGLKVLAIMLASVLWFTVAGEHVVERSLRVPLAVRNLPVSLEIVGDLPATVDVRVRGSAAQLSRLDSGDVVAMVDLATARTGTARLFHLRTDEVMVPYGIDVAQVLPPSIPLSIEKSVRRTVPIMPVTDGDPAPGFVVGRITADPATVQIIGPESHVREVAAATTEAVEIDGKSERVRDQVTVGVLDSSVRLAEQPLTATVVIEILPAPIERDVQGVPVRSRNLAQGLVPRVVPEVVRVEIRGQREALGRVRPDSIDAFVDLAGLGPGSYDLRVQVDPSEEFGVGTVTPSVVKVTIK